MEAYFGEVYKVNQDGERELSGKAEVSKRKLPEENEADKIEQPKENISERPEEGERKRKSLGDLEKKDLSELQILEISPEDQKKLDQMGIDAAREKLEKIQIPDPKVVEAVTTSQSVEWAISNIIGNNVKITSSKGQEFSSRQLMDVIQKVVYNNDDPRKIPNGEPYKLRDLVIKLKTAGAYDKSKEKKAV